MTTITQVGVLEISRKMVTEYRRQAQESQAVLNYPYKLAQTKLIKLK